jgi:hypothetical protein
MELVVMHLCGHLEGKNWVGIYLGLDGCIWNTHPVMKYMFEMIIHIYWTVWILYLSLFIIL